jgi:hypothetical protein
MGNTLPKLHQVMGITYNNSPNVTHCHGRDNNNDGADFSPVPNWEAVRTFPQFPTGRRCGLFPKCHGRDNNNDDANFSRLGGGADFPTLEFPSNILSI